MTDNNTPAIPDLSNDEEFLRSIATLDDAFNALKNAGLSVQDITEYGTGFHVADKATLVGVPFVVLAHKIVNGDFGPMSVLFAVTKTDDKVIIVDGSSGIHEQLAGNPEKKSAGLLAQGLRAPFLVPNGLTRSDYDYVDEKGNHKPATTFYLSS